MKNHAYEGLIIAEWLERPEDARTESDVPVFYGYLEKNRPDLLLFSYRGDKYQALKTILRNHIKRIDP